MSLCIDLCIPVLHMYLCVSVGFVCQYIVCVLDCELCVRVYTFVNMYTYIPVCVRLSVNACSVGGAHTDACV